MSNPAQYPRRTKCGIRKGPPFGLWIWCILLKCFISLPCIFSSCNGVDISVAIYPKNTINIPYGDSLELFCVAEEGTADDLEIKLGTTTLKSEQINSTTIRLFIERPEIQLNTYYCLNKKTRKPCTSRVLVDSPPSNVTDFSCLSRNLEVLNCSWTNPQSKNSRSTKNYSLTYLINGKAVKPTNATELGHMRYCSWNLTSEPRYRNLERTYHFVLTSCNVFGCIEQNFEIDHYSIVKPDKPSDLTVLESGPHSIELEWKVPLVISNLLSCGIDHKIEYQINKADNKSSFHSVNATGLPHRNKKKYKFLLSDLPYAHMDYEVRIFIKSRASKDLWSDHSYIIVHTASEKPREPPKTIAGAFDHSTYDYNRRRIYVYWKQLEEYEEAGAGFTYKVVIAQNNKYKTVYADKNKSLSYVILDDASLEAMDVRIWSHNDQGSSENSSHLYIPPEKDSHSLKLRSFTKLAFENGTYKLSWVGVENIDNYTLFWCQHNTTKICTGRMDFTVLEPNKSSHVIDLPKEYRYQFAISANNGTGTSGMIWAKCDISNTGISMFAFPLTLDHDAPGKSYVKVRWTLECALHDGIITGYLISYCPLRTTNLFDETCGKPSNIYISDPKQMDKNITGLLPYKTYKFTIALNTTSGLKNIENASTIITTTEDMPSSPRNIIITDIRNDSVLISWDPPLHRNGNIGKYVIYANGKEVFTDKVITTFHGAMNISSRRQAVVKGLNGLTNYSFTVQACNNAIGLCSKVGLNDAVVVQTKIGAPSKLQAPIVGNNLDVVKWGKPEISGGTVDMYQIRRIKDNAEYEEIINSTNLFLSLTACEGVVVSEKYQVRAINVDNISYNQTMIYPGEWSDASTVTCRTTDSRTITIVFVAVFGLIGVVYSSIKLYKKYRKMEDIKPVLPNGLGIPEKDISKYAFGGWNPNLKDEKPSSDEMLLLPNGKNAVSSETKPSEENCGTSDRTDSTALSDTSRGPVDRQVSTSDDGSDSSLHLEIEPVKADNSNLQDNEASSNSDTENSPENSPYFSDKTFKKNPGSGYVQPVVNPATGYVQSAPAPVQNTQKPMGNVAGLLNTQPTSSSYVMAGLSPPIFTTGVAPPSVLSHPPASSGYVRPEEAQAKSLVNFPKLGPPTKVFGPESLPTMPTLPPPAKHGADSSYIQLQSLDSLPSLKPAVRNTVPSKPPASRGYVSPGDPVISKHLNNMLSAGQLAEESAILDPTMSPDAYCRFSWSTDPANDNLRTLFADSPTINTPKN